ncbi:MAG: Coenzyme F420 hydrogenase/dehydrogenase, beta subunit C-terminal domain [Lachnospiraceae bacterium]|nr:Coenzyme F420 hydrogenase/dehydrogenase, beta subunit C-terminal domain [Lachnospiraceae bacterium]
MEKPLVYAVKHKDIDVRMASRSGGIFTAISDLVLREGGVVYGCALDQKFKASHIRAETKEERDRMRGSKYVQSDMADTLKNIRKDLEEGRYVLFSGTSCQVAGLYSFLGKDYGKQLFCMDILCQGVPSPLVWERYLQWQEEINGAKCTGVIFRNKRDFGWEASVETLTFNREDGTTKTVHSQVFRNLFGSHRILRESCYQCPYKEINHPGDMTIGDFWGIKRAAPKFDDNCGVSLVLINTGRAGELFDAVKEGLDYVSCRIEDSMQTTLKRPLAWPEGRDEFWRDFRENDFDYLAEKYGHYNTDNAAKLDRLAKKYKNRNKWVLAKKMYRCLRQYGKRIIHRETRQE